MRLSPLQRIKRRVWRFFSGSYTHPDGTMELDIDEKAGIDPIVDDLETQERKYEAWDRREGIRQDRLRYFFFGAVVAGLIVYWWLR